MRPKYKQLCAICRKNHVLISSYNQFPICTSCSMRQIDKPIEDEKFKKLFGIDNKLYEESSFLRSIKSNYLRFGNLSDRQIEMFKKVAGELKNPVGVKPTTTIADVAAAAAKKEGRADETKTKTKSRKK